MIFSELLLLDDSEPHSAALNMAIDEALLRSADAPLLRCYRWERSAVSFGYFGKFAEAENAWPGRDIVRRWTGGGIVPHGDDFTYSLIVPRSCPFAARSPSDSYPAIHHAVADALGISGVTLAESGAEKISDACFENFVRHDLVAGAGKVAGAAQRRTQAGLLHQGSIQLGSLPPGFAERLASALGAKIERRVLPSVMIAAAQLLAAEKYGSGHWLRRV